MTKRDTKALNLMIFSLMYSLGGTCGLLVGLYSDHPTAGVITFWGVFLLYLSYFFYVRKTPLTDPEK